MKKQIITITAIALFVTSIIFSCKKKDTTTPDTTSTTTTGGTTGGTTGMPTGYTGTINTGAINAYVVDTAKINTITQTGTNETTIINKTINTSSFINKMNVSLDGTKIVYGIYQQAPFTGTVQGAASRELRIANNNGSNDTYLYGVSNNSVDFNVIKYGLNNTIYFTQDTYYPNVSHTFCSIKSDGTGFQSANTYFNIDDISVDGNFFLTHSTNSSTGIYTSFTVIDKNGDNGAGSQFMAVNVSTINTTYFKDGTFTIDNKKVVIPYVDGSDLKVLILDLVNKTSTSKTFLNNVSFGYLNITLNMASDSNRGILTIGGASSSSQSQSYVIDLNAGTVLNQYNDNDSEVYMVYPY